MAATWPNFLCGFTVLCLINGVFSAITLDPENALVERCEDQFANMSCRNDAADEIYWTYDGNTVINSPCSANTPVFIAKPSSTFQCDIAASLTDAQNDANIQSISGPYGCSDRSNNGITSTSMVAVLDAWCGIVNGCPVMEGDDVTIGCYGQYDWLSYLLQYNPIVSLNSTIRFVDKAGTFRLIIPDVQRYPGPPAPENLTTSYTFNNVQAGQILNAECRIDFVFSKNTAYSGRQRYALNTLQWSSPISTPVNYCPRNVMISPRDACLPGEQLTCTAVSYPPAEIFWIEHHNNEAVVTGSMYTLKAGRFSVTCVARISVSCSSSTANEASVCRDPDSYAQREGNPADFPYSLFGFHAINPASSVMCNATDRIDGYATVCPDNMTMLHNASIVLTTMTTATIPTATTAATGGADIGILVQLILGIAVGVLVLIIIVIVIVLCVRKRRRADAVRRARKRTDVTTENPVYRCEELEGSVSAYDYIDDAAVTQEKPGNVYLEILGDETGGREQGTTRQLSKPRPEAKPQEQDHHYEGLKEPDHVYRQLRKP